MMQGTGVGFGAAGGASPSQAASIAMADPMAVFPSFGTVKGLFQGVGCSDFPSNGTGSFAPFGFSASGTASTVAAAQGTSARPGQIALDTGTTSTGRASMGTTAATCVAFGGGVWRYRFDGYVPVASDAVETFLAYAGFMDSNAAEPGNGVYFRYDYNVNGGRYECVCRQANIETVSDSGIAAVGVAYRALEIEVNAAGTSARFSVDGTIVATIAANIPGSAQPVGAFMSIRKTLGSTARTFRGDLMGFWFNATVAR